MITSTIMKRIKKFLREKKLEVVVLSLLTVLSCIIPFLVISIVSFSYNRKVGHEISEEEVLEFPDDFLWGTATASYQVEGGNTGSSWYRFEKEGNVKNNDSALIAVDHYNRYEEDIELMKSLNMNSYRFSLEWSRIEPEPGVFDYDEIEHYRDVLAELEKAGIKPMVTLWHHSVPAWFEDVGGWEKKENIDYYTEYVEVVVTELGGEVELWLTMNEPMAYITLGYVSEKWPPGENSIHKVPSLLKNVIKGHKRAYEIIHKADENAQVGIAEHASYHEPASKGNVLENIISFFIDYTWTYMPVDLISDELDFIGVHYYYKQTISQDIILDALTKEASEIENQSLTRSYYPEGLYETLLRFKKYDKPVYITEIGVPDYETVDRDQFIREHAREVYYAIEAGVDVKGFYYWTLLDCFEWSEGYGPKFGLISVNRDTLERSIKPESYEYALIAGCNCVYMKDEEELE